jgi:carboxylesterase
MTSEREDTNITENNSKHTWKKVVKIIGIVLVSALVLLLALGLIPSFQKDIPASPDPATSYEDAIQRFEKIQQAEEPFVKEVAASQLLTHGEKTDKVYVLIHGLTNSPHQFAELGELLYEDGNNVLLVRIPHHGVKDADISELGKMSIDDLTEYGDQVIFLRQILWKL